MTAVLAATAAATAAGCPARRQATTPAPRPSASPTAQGPALSATVVAPKLTLTDPKGIVVAKLTAEAATVAPEQVTQGTAYRGGLRNGTATLFQQGKPAATLKAKIMRADQAARTVVGEGDVVVRSLASPDAPAIRADTMTWRYDADQITGRGNVLVTREPDMRLPGDRFTADTNIRRFTLFGNGKSATGTF